LSNIWVNLTPLIASLWVASIAVAFALQNILSDLFSSFSILISKPFLVWDYIAVWDAEWTVNSITLKSTNLTNVAGQEVVIPNSTILSSKVVNFWKMKFRRERITIWVVYSTWLKYLKEIPDIIWWVIWKIDWVDFDWCYLKSLNDFSIDFLYSYQIHSPDLVDWLKINEKIYIWILDEFAKMWIDIAFPSQTIYTYNSDYNYKENPPK
jgi:small-conductance mechanosensitive channel